MSFRIRPNTCAILLTCFVAHQLSFAEAPIGIDIEFVEEASPVSTLEAVASPLIHLFFGGGDSLGGVVELFEVAVEAIVENEMMGVDMHIDDMEQTIHPIIVNELGFVRLVCAEMTIEQRTQVRSAAESTLKEIATRLATDLADEQADLDEGIEAARSEPLQEIRKTITDTLKSVLSEEQFNRYTKAATDRHEQRKKAAILSAVARIDNSLLLTTDQRDDIVAAISSHWQPHWEQWLGLHGFDGRTLPMIPDELVTPCLNDDQKLVWQDLDKVDFDDFWENGDAEGRFNDGWWGDVAPEAEPGRGDLVIEKRAAAF